MVISVLRLTLRPEKKADTIDILKLMIGPTTAKLGCIRCRLYDNHGSEEELLLLEEWESQKRLEQHLCSDEFMKTLEAMEMASEKPQLAFHTVSDTAGIELVKKLCQHV
jgi:quinol monooxygenase YgiN